VLLMVHGWVRIIDVVGVNRVVRIRVECAVAIGEVADCIHNAVVCVEI